MIDPTIILLDVQLLHPQFICLIGLILLSLIIFTIFIIVKYKNTKSKGLIFTGIVSILMIFGAIGFEVYLYQDYQYQLNYDILEYSLILDSNSEKNHIAYFPISENANLQNSIEIKEGTGQISIIESNHGKALMINFSDNILINGKIDTTNGISNYDLTMVNKTEEYHSVEYWVYYEPFNKTDYNCSFELKLDHESLDWGEFYYCEGFLKEGWNIYWAEHGAGS